MDVLSIIGVLILILVFIFIVGEFGGDIVEFIVCIFGVIFIGIFDAVIGEKNESRGSRIAETLDWLNDHYPM